MYIYVNYTYGQPATTSSLLAVEDDVFIIHVYGTTANNLDNNQPYRKESPPLIPTKVHPRLPGLTLTSVITWGKPERLTFYYSEAQLYAILFTAEQFYTRLIDDWLCGSSGRSTLGSKAGDIIYM